MITHRLSRAAAAGTALALAAGSGLAVAARPTGGATYAGKTKQKAAVSFKVNNKRTRIRKLQVADMFFPHGDPCVDPEPNPITSKDIPKIRVRKSGRFSGAHKDRFGDRFSIKGRFKTARTAKGSARIQVFNHGRPRCDTGAVRFTVKRK